MPEIPFTTQTLTPSDRPLGYFDIHPNPNAFGANVAQAVSGAAEAYGGMLSESEAKHADIELNNRSLKRLFDPDEGYMTKRGVDAAKGYNDVFAAMNKDFEDVRSRLSTNDARRMFDLSAVRSLRGFQMSAASHAAQETKSWHVQESESRIQNQITRGAAFWNDDNMFQTTLGTIQSEAVSRAEMLGQDKDKTEADVRHYQSEAIMARINAMSMHDPGAARLLFQKYGPEGAGLIDASHAAAIDDKLVSRLWQYDMHQAREEDRKEREAAKNLHAVQLSTEGDMFARHLRGEHIPNEELAHAVETQQVSLGFAHTFEALQKSPMDVASSEALVQLYTKARTEGITSEDIQHAAAAGVIGKLDAVALTKYINPDITPEAKHYHSMLHMITMADQAERGFIQDPEQRAQIGLLSIQADREFYDRLHKGEKPADIYNDMETRYAKFAPTPAAWPVPRSGAVHNSKEAETAAKSLDKKDPNYGFELELLSKYYVHYKMLEQRDEQLKATKGAKPGEKKGAEGANKVVGVSSGQ